ncbi:MAG: ATP-binding response regulator, partial [Candidatus Binatia bacterium]
ALRWLPEVETQVEEETEQTSRRTPTTFDRDVPGVQPQEQRARILLADDNADMREYISRLLGRRFDVRAVTDGQAALEAAQAEPPDLVISDIMMPRLDGFGLLLKLRADSQLREVPIILLSARAGEESRIEGMEAGANDYLIKPFTARELLARVGAHIEIARVRREATEKIRSSEAELRDFVENANVGLHRVNSDGIILWANHTELDLLGYTHEEYIGHSISQFHVDASVSGDILARLSRGEMVRECEARMRCKDGSIRYVLINSSGFFQEGKFIYSRCFTQDISERKRIEQQLNEFSHELEKQVSERTAELRQANRALLQDIEERERLEEQLRQSQRLESMGILAAGVAHDLNNLLNIIQGYASLLEPGATSADIEESTDAITETTKRGAVLVQQLLALARKTEIKMESVDINKLIQGLSSLIKGTFPKNIDISLNLAPTALRIEADASQVNQVLLNLCVNARDAMPDGGILTLKTSIVDGLDLDGNDGLQAEGYVAIQITDTGTGMDKNVQSKIFEPFFTTKEIGKGTGLGLAVAYGIVKSHNGFVNVKSEPMQGTTFFLYFPAMSVAE